ncbi:hypothetical protein A2858_02515 [Candidatus Daviesbacteria bacterium RIFCSPHIGHO2_01_FULL_36_37]|uniref:Uncharacterized protein n=3 Tax=Candidatus Daviesiibacteriota TaxID=1752718 RepID=A0A1F5K1I9_9BACT|nr:MAG: hypothetical protein US28_C0017G0003 [Candidatus Daviesbacteria bacterium GW2011_GWA1_36_8]OGE16687.1 MAG: hypothetical protein A2858_02515 [Candidatus Daviesbacteria bacterium RIFCSPHIGHO2_01_FULL_36_37]OGE34764.1 MAG: hypothetical protein A3E66_04035 [Candidatus Daviesbacteria bacterium RIFCSPHIGHO2_12_FULL_37_16]
MTLLEKLTLKEKKDADKYKSLVNSRNFENKLANSILDDECLICGDGDVLKHGLCLSCSVRIGSPLTQIVLREYEVSITVKHIGSR